MDQKILIVEDNVSTRQIINAALGKKFFLAFAETATQAVDQLKLYQFDLVILDVELPGEDGFHFCAKLRADERFKESEIIFLTGKNTTADKVLGFSLGADDYITKPFDIIEFQARLDAKMRRISDRKNQDQILYKGAFEINLPKQKIYIKEGESSSDLDLTSIEFKLLTYLLGHEEHVLSRDQILNEVWGMNVHINDRTVDAHIYMLRQKLGEYSGCIKSVKNAGYRFIQKKKDKKSA
jgi:two-component system phosphate regulon response regulator PhoB